MLSTNTAAALVGGAGRQPMENVFVKVTRAFLHGRVPQPVGSVIELPSALAAELVSMNKAERCAAPAAPQEKEPAPARRKEKQSAE